MIYNELIANSNTAFAGGQFEIALEYAKKSISFDPKMSEGYYCAGKACMSMEQTIDAAAYFKKATEIEKTNGNGYFLLGYAQILSGNTSLCDEIDHMPKKSEFSGFFAYVDTKILFAKPWIT